MKLYDEPVWAWLKKNIVDWQIRAFNKNLFAFKLICVMKKIFLDSEIILRHPELLSLKRDDAELIIPDAVLREVQAQRRAGFGDINNLIQNSKAKGYVSIVSIPDLPADTPGDTIWSVVDTSVIRYLRTIQAKTDGNEVIFVTDDKMTVGEAKFAKVTVWSDRELIDFYRTPGSIKDADIKKEAIQIENKVRWGILSNLLLAILFLVSLVLIVRYYGDIVDRLKNTILIIILVVFGFLLFEVREKRRQLYGFVEVGFGVLTITIVFYPYLISNNWDKLFKIAAGLYVIVRGLDNLYKGSENRKLGSLLKRLFRLDK